MKFFTIICLSAFLTVIFGCSEGKVSRDEPSPPVTSHTTAPTPSAAASIAPVETAPVITETPQPVSVILLSEFTTPIHDKEEERVNNIGLASEAIDGVVVKSGEVFSFNDIVGMRTRKKGYKEATVLVGKEKTKGLGGGVCQVSTTLYQAAKNGGFVIVERHRHEVEVSYAPGGMDASVNYDNLDFRFRNNRENDIKIAADTDGESVTVQIFNVQ